MQEVRGSIPGRGTTDFCTLILFVYIQTNSNRQIPGIPDFIYCNVRVIYVTALFYNLGNVVTLLVTR